jgi:hypothetical protein
MKVQFDKRTRIGRTTYNRGVVADLPEIEARQQIANGRASLLPSTPLPQPETIDPEHPEVPYRDTSQKSFFTKG